MGGQMRTAGAAAEELKRIDPMTPIRRHTIDVWARQGLIHSVKVGNRRLVSMDSLMDYMTGSVAGTPKAQEEPAEPPRGGIRRIDI